MPPEPAAPGFTRRTLLRAAGAAAIGTACGTAAHGYLYERHRIVTVQESLGIQGWPEPLAGLRVGFLTDLHRSATGSHEMVVEAVRSVMAHAPDLIVLGGDYITNHDRRYAGPAAEALAGLSAPHGVYAILGNHDDERDVPAALRAAGMVVLKDARTRLSIRGEEIDIAGLRYWTHRLSDVERVVAGGARNLILLAHTPSRIREAAELSVPLVLSGHTHGGQIVLPVLGPIAARRFPVIAGTAEHGRTTIFVSRGVGTVYIPVRVNCPPEVAILHLRPAAGAREG